MSSSFPASGSEYSTEDHRSFGNLIPNTRRLLPSVTAVLRNRKEKKKKSSGIRQAGTFILMLHISTHWDFAWYILGEYAKWCAPSKRNISAGIPRIPEIHTLLHVTFAKVIHRRLLQLSWVILVNTKSTASVLTQDRHRGEGKVKMETETALMGPPAQGRWATSRSWKERGTHVPLESLREEV